MLKKMKAWINTFRLLKLAKRKRGWMADCGISEFGDCLARAAE